MLDAPSLVAINCYFSHFKLKHPYSVRFLSVSQLDEPLFVFQNVEQIEIQNQPNVLDLNSLQQFGQLKVLKMRSLLSEDRDLADKLKELIGANKHLKIYCLEMELDEHGLDLNSTAFARTILERLVYSYEKMDNNLDWITAINYNDLIDLINSSLPPTLFSKLNNIQTIVASSQITDPYLFACFVADCPVLSCLETRFSQLDERFFDQLPAFSCLSKLTIYGTQELDFRFISRMFHLQSLSTNLDIAWSEDFRLDRLKFLEVIDFKLCGHQFFIKKEGHDRWSCHNDHPIKPRFKYRYTHNDFGDSRLPGRELCFQEMAEWCTCLRIESTYKSNNYSTYSRQKREFKEESDENIRIFIFVIFIVFFVFWCFSSSPQSDQSDQQYSSPGGTGFIGFWRLGSSGSSKKVISGTSSSSSSSSSVSSRSGSFRGGGFRRG